MPCLENGWNCDFTSGHPAQTGHPEGFESPNRRQPPRAHLAESGDDIAGVGPGELHGVFAQAGEALGEVGHRTAVVAIVLGAAGEQIAAEAFEGRFELLVACEVQRAEAVDERGQAVERALVDAVFRSVDGGENLAGQPGGLVPQ
jgi:hypothetical protein